MVLACLPPKDNFVGAKLPIVWSICFKEDPIKFIHKKGRGGKRKKRVKIVAMATRKENGKEKKMYIFKREREKWKKCVCEMT